MTKARLLTFSKIFTTLKKKNLRNSLIIYFPYQCGNPIQLSKPRSPYNTRTILGELDYDMRPN